MHPNHDYKLTLKWTGNKGTGTSGYRAYDRNHEILIEGKTTLLGSADPSFHGDKTVHNPEDLLLASLSACHRCRICTFVSKPESWSPIMWTMPPELWWSILTAPANLLKVP